VSERTPTELLFFVKSTKRLNTPDPLEFPDGQIELLTSLKEGQKATVLQLPAAPKTEAEYKAQARAGGPLSDPWNRAATAKVATRSGPLSLSQR
jgi:hypothetical protein